MKKIKIMITAITVFAIVGGALAFKAKRFGSTVYTTTNPHLGADCPYPLFGVATNPGGTNPISVTISAPDVANPNGYKCIVVATKIKI